MATVTTPRLLTVEEYEQTGEVLGFRDELIEGERVLSPSPIFKHMLVIVQLERILNNQLSELSSESLRVVRETGWRFQKSESGADSVPIPDVMVIREEDAVRAGKSDGWFEGVPLLVIEVISPSERRARRLQKVGLYLDMGVPSVVEVDYMRRALYVYTPETDSAVVYRQGDQVISPFRATVDEIFSVLD